MRLRLSEKQKIIVVILIAVALNVITFCFAYPETFKPESATLARDFSAYYIGEWRLFHNPTKIYAGGPQQGDYQILPQPQTFEYTPSSLILFAPLLALSYQNALNAFDIIQLALIPALAFFVYKLVKDKNLVLAAIAAATIIFSPIYYSGYVVANAHILQCVLLIGALYFGFAKNPWLSALLFAFGSFDPRAALLALPLLLWYNRQKILKFTVATVAFLLATNLPFFFYYGIGLSFLHTEVNGKIVSHMYLYDWIPIYAVAALTVIEIITFFRGSRKIHFTSP